MKKVIALILCVVMVAAVFAACAAGESDRETAEETTENTEDAKEEKTEETAEKASDDAAAAAVDELIKAIQIQEWTPETEANCKAAKSAWDALTEDQKEKVEEKDYFGLDTGDASKDDPLNKDDIGEKEILVVSFGTSFNDSRAEDIGGIEKAIAAAYPDWAVRRAFTAQIIINHVFARDGESIDNVDQALKRAVDNGVKKIVIQPTHLMHGAEYDELTGTIEKYLDKFETVAISEPLLGEVGADASAINQDKKDVASTVYSEAIKELGYASKDEMKKAGAAIVFLGHGTSHTAKVTYSQMQETMKQLGLDNAFIGTVEGEPEETKVDNVIAKVAEAGYKQVVLRPLMVVAGDHANNDMAGADDDTWFSLFEASGKFEGVQCQIAGLGRISDIQKLYVKHIGETLGAGDLVPVSKDGDASAGVLADGTYSADFNTDSSMFHVNETLNNKGVLTVKDGKMTIHVSLVSKNVVNVFPGLAADAQKDGAVLLQPTEDEVKYSDGTTETVYGFDIPVEKIGEDFDLAIIGTKGKWYDHKVSVTNPEPAE